MKKFTILFALLFIAFSAKAQLVIENKNYQNVLTFNGPQYQDASTTWYGDRHVWLRPFTSDPYFSIRHIGSRSYLNFGGPEFDFQRAYIWEGATTTHYGQYHAWVNSVSGFSNKFFMINLSPWNYGYNEIITSDGILWFVNLLPPGGSTSFTTIYALDFWSPSDLSAKTNIAPVSGALKTVLALKPVTYQWIDQSMRNRGVRATSNPKEIGFIAQDLEKVIPDVVAIGEDDKRLVNYQAIIPILTGAIQELNARIEALEQQLKNK